MRMQVRGQYGIDGNCIRQFRRAVLPGLRTRPDDRGDRSPRCAGWRRLRGDGYGAVEKIAASDQMMNARPQGEYCLEVQCQWLAGNWSGVRTRALICRSHC